MKNIFKAFIFAMTMGSSFAFADLPSTSKITGTYLGWEFTGESCRVDITGGRNFWGQQQISVSVSSDSVGTLALNSIATWRLDRKLAQDTQWRQTQEKHFDPNYLYLGIYPQSTLGYGSSNIESLQISWRDGKLYGVTLVEVDSSSGLFHVHDGRQISCLGLAPVQMVQ